MVSLRALGAFDVAVELRPLRRQDKRHRLRSACVLELALKFVPPSTGYPRCGRGLGNELVEQGAAQRAVAPPATRAKVHFATGS